MSEGISCISLCIIYLMHWINLGDHSESLVRCKFHWGCNYAFSFTHRVKEILEMRRRCQKAVHNEDAHQLNYLCDHFIHFHDRLKVNLIRYREITLLTQIKWPWDAILKTLVIVLCYRHVIKIMLLSQDGRCQQIWITFCKE